jgi:hypothetical protein
LLPVDAVTWTVIVRLAEAPFASAIPGQVTVPSLEPVAGTVHPVRLTLTKLKPLGRVTLIVADAGDGPLLVAVTV